MGLQTPPGSDPWGFPGSTAGGSGEVRALQGGDGLPQYNPQQETSMHRAESASTPGPTRETCLVWLLDW